MDQYWPDDLDYTSPVGEQDMPCTGRYILIASERYLALKSKVESSWHIPTEVSMKNGLISPESAMYVHPALLHQYAPIDSYLLDMQWFVNQAIAQNRYKMEAHLIQWRVIFDGERMNGLLVGPLDGPLYTTDVSKGTPEATGMKEKLVSQDPDIDARIVDWIWQTPRIY